MLTHSPPPILLPFSNAYDRMRSRMKTAAKRFTLYTAMYAAAALALGSCYAPSANYATTAMVTERRATLQENLLLMLPPELRNTPEAKQEAQWIADTAYKAGAGIARINDSNFPGWAGNYLINSRIQDRGLCWHYQHDMYRELRRRPLSYFNIGCCGRDIATRREHNCVYVSPKHSGWPHAWVLDAWPWNGRLQVFNAWELDPDQWKERRGITDFLAEIYTEGHDYPMEHWLSIRSKRKWYELSIFGMPATYMDCWWPETWFSPQYRNMMSNIIKGQQEHPESPTNY